MIDGVLKPGRYINNEWNAAHKEWQASMLKVALCFPDIYEIGMSHLGMRIIYGVLNQEEDVVCERVFVPWSDMEKMIRSGQDIFLSLENRNRLKDFDIIGFSLQYEMNFVDVLNMLDLAQISVRSSERTDKEPLIIAGGPCCFNPEPMADFIDAFVIGEGEETLLDIVSLVKALKSKVKGYREELLKELSKIEGVYVPQYTIRDTQPTITKRIVKDLDNSYFPTAPIVPYIQIVHDRISLEIMRGCPHKCRFCQARKIFHPFRIRSVDRILEIAQRSVENSGYEEISLLSLSTSDYPYLESLVSKLEQNLEGLGVKISLPSIRAQSFMGTRGANIVKRAGLTFAPEAGSDRLRRKLDKQMTNEEIIKKSELAFKAGWKKIKLYFMIGLPGETYDDLDAIIKLASEIGDVSLSISPFIPKPHSDLERDGMEDLGALKDKRSYLYSRLEAAGRKRQNIKIDFHDLEMSKIEAILSRGDRRVGEVIKRVWQKGGRLQAWNEYFRYNLWMDSFEEADIDPEYYLKKRVKDIMPWSFIDMD